jgi:hypothetical protein
MALISLHAPPTHLRLAKGHHLGSWVVWAAVAGAVAVVFALSWPALIRSIV